MQSADYLEGKIYVLNGLGTAEVPNYYLIYNTTGDIIGEYVFDSFAEQEPEGVYVDRQTKEVFLSMGDKSIYKIMQ